MEDQQEVTKARNEWLRSMVSPGMFRYVRRLKRSDFPKGEEYDESLEYHLFMIDPGQPFIQTWRFGQPANSFWQGIDMEK